MKEILMIEATSAVNAEGEELTRGFIEKGWDVVPIYLIAVILEEVRFSWSLCRKL